MHVTRKKSEFLKTQNPFGFRIHIIEDDPWYGEILTYHLTSNPDFSVFKYETAAACLESIDEKPNLITLDYSLPDMDGLELLKKIKEMAPDVPVIVISGQEAIGKAISMIRAGASEYFVKDDHTKDLLWNAVVRIRETELLKKEVEKLREELGQKLDFSNAFNGNSKAIKHVFNLLEKASTANINVSISGETGTGKELAAKSIHYNSDRRKKPFIAVNMGAIPSELMESELFGYEKGAFTGANSRKTGKFEEAHTGTLFLDEVAELDLNLQTKLLRVLQERELQRIGGHETIKFDVRLIVATNKNLSDEVKKGNFREDLYYRIMGMPIMMPPLRKRGDDILILSRHFLDHFCIENNLPKKQISQDAADKLLAHPFPGNIRELKSAIELAAVMTSDQEIKSSDISFNAVPKNDLFFEGDHTLRHFTTQIIESYLKRFNYNVVKTAQKLDMGKSTIYKMIQDGEITIPD